MPKMFEKITYAINTLLILAAGWFRHLTMADVAMGVGIFSTIVTMLGSLYFQRRQTRAIEAAAAEGKTIIPRPE